MFLFNVEGPDTQSETKFQAKNSLVVIIPNASREKHKFSTLKLTFCAIVQPIKSSRSYQYRGLLNEVD